MLSRIEIKNFRGFGDNFVFDLTQPRNYEFNSFAIKNNVVNKAIIYGANGSGKSNLGYAIFDIIGNLTDFLKKVDYTNDYLNAESENGIAEFKFYFKFENDSLTYKYSKKNFNEIGYEEIIINDEQIVFYDPSKRGTPILKLENTESLKFENFYNLKISFVKYIINNSSLSREYKNSKVFLEFIKFVHGMLFFCPSSTKVYYGYTATEQFLFANLIDDGKLVNFEKFLKSVGIHYDLVEYENNGSIRAGVQFKNKVLDFVNIASTGTYSLLILFYWLEKLDSVSFVFIDEFDAYYHYDLSKMIISELNKLDCQSIITTHNTSIMSNDLLRPDCYFVMDGKSIKPLYAFTDKELREAHNIEKMYRAGAFQ